MNSSDHFWEVSQAVSRCSLAVSIFCFSGGLRHIPDTPSSLRRFAGSAELDESCGNDAEDELVLELDDSPGTATGTKFFVLHRNVFPSLVRCGF